MARARKKNSTPKTLESATKDYRHKDATRKNIPPAKIAAEGVVPALPKQRYHYSPRRPPELRFDPAGATDKLPELLEKAKQGPLTDEEALILAEALRNHQPWLEWAEKQEQHDRGYFEVDPVALLVHERISAQAILKIAGRQDVQRDLFADPQHEYHQAVQFYQHDIDWANRLILGDSLQIMSSLATREDLAGKVQMIYMDPPYGIKFASNFQPEIGKKDVKDKDTDLTREPETVKAYRDTWHLGIHSYLSYLRDRIELSRHLLTDEGSIFVQISDDNIHRVRLILDEVFGPDNFFALVTLRKTGGLGSSGLTPICDFLLWYTKNRSAAKFRMVFASKEDTGTADQYNLLLDPNGAVLPKGSVSERARRWQATSVHTMYAGVESCLYDCTFDSKRFRLPANRQWSTTLDGMTRIYKAGRLHTAGNVPRLIRYLDDYPVTESTTLWADFMGTRDKVYTVQTNERIVERCMLMSTDPGDIVLDPTCGSGTTAYVAEQWGRRWITIDTSRVAVSIARQRLLTAKFDYFKTRTPADDPNGNPDVGFVYKTVPHVTLKSISQNTNLDPIFEKHEPILDAKLTVCNMALRDVSDAARRKLNEKLLQKQKSEGKRAITDADTRRWKLPKTSDGFQHWTVPFDTDPDWPESLQKAVTEYRKAWRAKMDEVNACIEANADQEELVDQPEVVKGVTRVSGPFTVESVQPPELSLGDDLWEGKFDGAPDELEDTFDGAEPRSLRIVTPRDELEATNLNAYLDRMVQLLRMDGVRFPNNKEMKFSRLDMLENEVSGLHAEGRWVPANQTDEDPEGTATVCVAFGPQYGPVTAKMVEELVRNSSRRGYTDLVIAGFSFDGPAQAVIEEAQHPKLRIHMAHIRPDVNPSMDNLLKDQPKSQLFSVFGQPRIEVNGPDSEDQYIVKMEGVDIYNPVTNEVQATGATKVAAWFLDSDYDGRTFCVTQAFFPDKSAWNKLAKALKGVLDEDAFDALSGTESLPFPKGKHGTIAVKVIDPRGNEVMKVQRLNERT